MHACIHTQVAQILADVSPSARGSFAQYGSELRLGLGSIIVTETTSVNVLEIVGVVGGVSSLFMLAFKIIVTSRPTLRIRHPTNPSAFIMRSHTHVHTDADGPKLSHIVHTAAAHKPSLPPLSPLSPLQILWSPRFHSFTQPSTRLDLT